MAARKAILFPVLLLIAAAAGAAQPKKDEIMLAELVSMLGGSYDNIAQSRASSDHPALRLMWRRCRRQRWAITCSMCRRWPPMMRDVCWRSASTS